MSFYTGQTVFLDVDRLSRRLYKSLTHVCVTTAMHQAVSSWVPDVFIKCVLEAAPLHQIH